MLVGWSAPVGGRRSGIPVMPYISAARCVFSIGLLSLLLREVFTPLVAVLEPSELHFRNEVNLIISRRVGYNPMPSCESRLYSPKMTAYGDEKITGYGIIRIINRTKNCQLFNMN